MVTIYLYSRRAAGSVAQGLGMSKMATAVSSTALKKTRENYCTCRIEWYRPIAILVPVLIVKSA